MWAKVVLAAVSCKRRAAAAVDTPAESVDVVADEPDGREAASVVVLDHASLSRRACDALSRCRLAGGHAAVQRRSPGCCSKPGALLLLNAFAFEDRNWIAAQLGPAAMPRANRRSCPMDVAGGEARLVSIRNLPTILRWLGYIFRRV